MRFLPIYIIAGVLGLFAGALAAPALSYGYCVDASTVTVTASQLTLYVNVGSASSGVEISFDTVTLTSTQYSTLYLTTPALTLTTVIPLRSSSAKGLLEASNRSSIATITSAASQTSQALSVASSADDPCYFYFDEVLSTTSYLNCPAPATTDASLVFETTTFLVIPTPVAVSSTEDHTSTLTLHSTIQSTINRTITSVLPSTILGDLTVSSLVSSTLTGLFSAPSGPSSQFTTLVSPNSFSDGRSLLATASTSGATSTIISQGTGLPYTGLGYGGWNGTTSSSAPFATGNVGYGAQHYSTTSATNSSLLTVTASSHFLVTTLSSFNIYSQRPTLTLSTLKAASGFQYPQPSSSINNANSTGGHFISKNVSSVTSSAHGVPNTTFNGSQTISGTHGQQTYVTGLVTGSSTSHTEIPSVASTYVNSTVIPLSSRTALSVVQTTTSSPATLKPTVPTPEVLNGRPSSSLLNMNTTTVPNTSASTSSVSALSSNALPINIASGSLPLGAQCSTSSQCANGASCYAFNSALIPICGNFDASCTRDEECAFNTCVGGLCNGPFLISAVTSSSVFPTVSHSITSMIQRPSVSPIPAFASQNSGASNRSMKTSPRTSLASSYSSSGIESSMLLSITTNASIPASLIGGIATQQPSFSRTESPASSLGTFSNSSIDSQQSFSTYSSSVFSFLTSTIPSMTLSKSATSTSSLAISAPSLCGEHGDFVLNFDDIPPLQVGNKSNIQPAPVFNPYHQFDFSDGFTVVPPPTDPYLPSSKPLLLEFIPNYNIDGTNSQADPNAVNHGYSGQISDGDHGLTGCFLFNLYGASFGCDSRGPNCDFVFSGYRYDIATGHETLIAVQDLAVPACPPLSNCALTAVTLTDTFQNLTHVRINATVASVPKMWWMDDLRLGWFDNSCKTGLCRQEAHIH